MQQNDLGDNDTRFVNFWRFYRLVVGSTLSQQRTSYKPIWVLTDRQRRSNQINRITFSGKFKSCLLDVDRRKGTNFHLLPWMKWLVALVHEYGQFL